MWVFADFGLLMPAIVPDAVKDREDVLAWTNNGEYELQVRGRLEEHLRYFMDNHMPEGTFNNTIQRTPDKDYNYRFYTTREAFGEGIKSIAVSMDYEKFKVTSERFSWNKKYHQILNSIWATVCGLNTPGGFYGEFSDENPYGYKPGQKYGYGYEDSWYENRHRKVGDTFYTYDTDGQIEFGNVDLGDSSDGYDFPDYSDYRSDSVEAIIADLEGIGLEVSDWPDYCTEAEWALVEQEYGVRMKEIEREEAMNQKEIAKAERKMSRSLRRSTKKRRPHFGALPTRRH